MPKTEKISKHTHAIILDDGRCYTMSNRPMVEADAMVWSLADRNWEFRPMSIGEFKVVPFGHNNDIPNRLRDTLDDNNLAPGILERQLNLMYGQGPFLYRLGFDGGEIKHIWTEDREIQAWLDSWDVRSYIIGCATDYLYLKGFFNAVHLQRGHRIGRTPFIDHLEHLVAKNARLEWPEDSINIRDVRRILVGDFEHGCVNTGIRPYPVYDPKDPGRYGVSAAYISNYSFSRDFYSVPQYWGALRWIVRGSDIPTIFKYVTDNGLNLAYHVHSPKGYWDAKRDALREMHRDWDESRIEQEISSLTEKLLRNLTEVLSGKENAGKFFHTVDINDGDRVESWKIDAIDQKIKDFVESQLKISEASVSAITSGMGLHPSLSNVMVNGKLASGSEMLYAFKLYLLSDAAIKESTILEPLNQAIAFNFPGKDLRIGFYHTKLETEESISSGDRIKNQ